MRPMDAEQISKEPLEGKTTHTSTSLESAWQFYRQGAAEAPPGSRVLLVSDGHDHGDADPVATAERLGLTVDVLPPSSEQLAAQSPKVTVTGVQTVPRVLIGSELRLGVSLRRGRAGQAQTVTLRLREDGKSVLVQQVKFEADQLEQQVDLRYRPDAPG